MSVTLEVGLPDLVISLADYNTNSDFRAAVSSARKPKELIEGFITFLQRRNNQVTYEDGGDNKLWRIFHNMEQKELFPAKSSDEEIIEILHTEAETAINNTENIIRKRIDQLVLLNQTYRSFRTDVS